jgi:hypothetical protein
MFVVTFDTKSSSLEINSYVNFKIYSIIFINFHERIVQRKIHGACKSGKRCKMRWMGLQVGLGMDGVWMGHMDHGGMGLKHYVLGLALPMHRNPCWAPPKHSMFWCHVMF